MGMTMTQKILTAHAGLNHVEAGQPVEVNLDMVLGSNITSPAAIKEFKRCGFSQVLDPGRISMVVDYFVPNKDTKAAQQCKVYHTLAYARNIKHFYDVEETGIEHAPLPEKGIVGPGGCTIGVGSHTYTCGALNTLSTGVGSADMAADMATGKCRFKIPKAIKFDLCEELASCVSRKGVALRIIGMIGVDDTLYKSTGFSDIGLQSLSMDDCLCMANMAIGAGAKNGVLAFDEITEVHVKGRVSRPYATYETDADAEHCSVYHLGLSQITHTVASPHLPEDIKTMDKIEEPVRIDQIVIGSCTNGQLPDMAEAVQVLKGQYVTRGVCAIVILAIQGIYKQRIQLGYVEILIDAGCMVSTPTCGPCLGGYMGILAENERCVTTTSRNFVGQMGHVDSEVYLASPAVAAASVTMGRIVAPKEIA